jgi:gamma-glutamyl:cysteine ligase YbdK (ATP-grasp superfamily)
MKFGLEAEKFLFDMRENKPSQGVYSFLDALHDFNSSATFQITNEFVLNMVEIGTTPSENTLGILEEYLFYFLLLQTVASREDVALVSLGTLPIDFEPHMTPKWAYYVQNSILNQKRLPSWGLHKNSPLGAAGNCAGVHVHTEIETSSEFLFSTNELKDKFNMGLMLTPMIAFSSSPYFNLQHEASSMRGLEYYNRVYKNFPFNGALPPMMNSSEEVLLHVKRGINSWIESGVGLGFSRDEMKRLTSIKGANWSPIRWNRQWNTIELRALDSDRVDFDCSKFLWITSAMRRMDLSGEALKTKIIQTHQNLDEKMLDDVLIVEGGNVSVLPTAAMQDLFNRSITSGLNDVLVQKYLHKLISFIENRMQDNEKEIFQILKDAFYSRQTTSSKISAKWNARSITNEAAVQITRFSIQDQVEAIGRLRVFFPEVFIRLSKMGVKI